MAHKPLIVLVIVSLIGSSIQDVSGNKVDSQEESPLADIAKEILKEKNLENIGGVVNSFIQSGGAKQIMDGVLQNLGKENSGQILESLGSLLNSAGDSGGKKTKKRLSSKSGSKEAVDSINPMELLSGLGSIVGAMQGAGGEGGQGNPAAVLQGLGSLLGAANDGGGGNNAAALLQGLGSLLGSASQEKGRKQGGDDNNAGALLQGLGSLIGAAAAAENQDGGGNLLQGLGSLLGSNGQINPEMIGNAINMFANSQNEDKQATKPSKTRPPKKAASPKKKPKKGTKTDGSDKSFDFSSIINIASSFLSQGNKEGGSNFMDYLPMIMDTVQAFTGEQAQATAKGHSGHSWSLPPVLEKVHIYFDSFMNSEMGKRLVDYLETQKAFKAFLDENGKFNYPKFQELIENHSFRKHWIQQLTAKLVDFLKLVSDENIQNQYIDMGVVFTNSFLTNSGFPKTALLDLERPVKSMSSFVNFAAKNYLDADVDSKEYVEPVVGYVQDLLKLTKESVDLRSDPRKLTDKLADTINMDIIEPIIRVNRAYRFVKTQPTCERYIYCIINQKTSLSDPGSLPRLKELLYKGSSLISGWFLTSHTGSSYWDLYDVVAENRNCQTYYNDACEAFYQEEIKVTTEYVHNEL